MRSGTTLLTVARRGSDEVSQLSEVPADRGLDEVRDAGVTVLAALDYLLDLPGEGLGQVDRVVPVLPAGHSKLTKTSLVYKVCIITYIS